MNHVLYYLKLPAATDDLVRIAATKAAIPCVEASVEDFGNR